MSRTDLTDCVSPYPYSVPLYPLYVLGAGLEEGEEDVFFALV